jgi:hypothetical protein
MVTSFEHWRERVKNEASNQASSNGFQFDSSVLAAEGGRD